MPNQPSFAERIRGESQSPLELHLQSCVQALLAVYQREIMQEDANDADLNEYSRGWIKSLDYPAPAEAPIAVVIKGNKVILKSSNVILEAVTQHQNAEMTKGLACRSDGFRRQFQRTVLAELNYREEVLNEAYNDYFLPPFKDALGNEVKIDKREVATEMPLDAFGKVLNKLMRENKEALQLQAAMDGTPPSINHDLLEAHIAKSSSAAHIT